MKTIDLTPTGDVNARKDDGLSPPRLKKRTAI
jgi:hypothetical protein